MVSFLNYQSARDKDSEMLIGYDGGDGVSEVGVMLAMIVLIV